MSADTPAPERKARNTLPALTDFTPVPRLVDRSNGWKPHIQRAFIEALAETGSVRAACRRVGRADHGAYLLRRHPEAESFRKAWDAALDLGVRRIEDAAMDRALYGTEETIHYRGEHVATRRRYNERLVMFILRNRAADRFGQHGAKGPNAIGKMELARLKKEWRAEWEAERLAAYPEQERAAGEAFLARLEKEHNAWWSLLSPRTRAAYEEYKRLEDEDRANGYLSYADPEHENYIDPHAPMTEEDLDLGSFLTPPGRIVQAGEEAADEPENPQIRRLKDEGWR